MLVEIVSCCWKILSQVNVDLGCRAGASKSMSLWWDGRETTGRMFIHFIPFKMSRIYEQFKSNGLDILMGCFLKNIWSSYLAADCFNKKQQSN